MGQERQPEIATPQECLESLTATIRAAAVVCADFPALLGSFGITHAVPSRSSLSIRERTTQIEHRASPLPYLVLGNLSGLALDQLLGVLGTARSTGNGC